MPQGKNTVGNAPGLYSFLYQKLLEELGKMLANKLQNTYYTWYLMKMLEILLLIL